MFNFFAQTTSAESGAGSVFMMLYLVLIFAIILVSIVGTWKMFEKAGQPGWASIVPFYNTYILVKIAGRPGWWFLLYLIPFVNIVVSIIIAIDIAKKFGKSDLFGIFALWLFSFVGYLILGFGDAKYNTEVHSNNQ